MPVTPDPELPAAAVLDALHQLVDVSQPLGLHAPSPAEREQVLAKATALRQTLPAQASSGVNAVASARLRALADELESTLHGEHDLERWRATHARMLASHQRLQTEHGLHDRGHERVKPHNLRRSVFHAGSGIAWALVYEHVFDRPQMLLALACFLVLFATDDVMRRWFPDRRSQAAVAVFRLLSRPSESDKIASSTWYTLGLIVGVLTLPDHAFLLGVLVLALADPAAALVGRRFGRRRLYRDKSVIGSAAFFTVAFVIAAVIIAMRFPGLSAAAWLGSAAVIAATGTVAELLGGHVQDNVSIPVATGAITALLL